MLQRALKTGMIVLVLGLAVQNANAFGHRGYSCGPHGCGLGGYGACGPWGCGYTGWGYGGWGYGSWYSGWYANNAGLTSPGYVAHNVSSAPSLSGPRTISSNSPVGYSGAQAPASSLMLTVNVPADAKVTINGRVTNSTGAVRQYTSTGLQTGAIYRYQVRAEFTRDGKPVTEEQTLDFTAGESRSIAFNAQPGTQVAGATQPAQR